MALEKVAIRTYLEQGVSGKRNGDCCLPRTFNSNLEIPRRGIDKELFLNMC